METDSKTLKNIKQFVPQIESISNAGIATIVICSLICFGGFYALYVQLTEGHIVTGMRDNVVWGLCYHTQTMVL